MIINLLFCRSLASCIHQLLDSDIRTLAGDRWREMGTKEVGGWGVSGGGCHLAVLSRLADLHHLSAPLISIHFSPGTFIRAYHKTPPQKTQLFIVLGPAEAVTPFQPRSKQQKFFCRWKMIQIPLFQSFKKIQSRLIHSVRRTKTTICVGYWMFLNCPVKHNSVRLMASFTQ